MKKSIPVVTLFLFLLTGCAMQKNSEAWKEGVFCIKNREMCLGASSFLDLGIHEETSFLSITTEREYMNLPSGMTQEQIREFTEAADRYDAMNAVPVKKIRK